MKKKKTIFHLLNHDQTIKITEDNENNGFKYYIEHRKHKNIIYLFKDNNDENSNVKYGYCLKCSKFISRDSSNISKHQNSLHKTFVENLEEINNKIMKLLIEVNASHTHTVCVPYYKAAPYNISHTKIFSRAK